MITLQKRTHATYTRKKELTVYEKCILRILRDSSVPMRMLEIRDANDVVLSYGRVNSSMTTLKKKGLVDFDKRDMGVAKKDIFFYTINEAGRKAIEPTD